MKAYLKAYKKHKAKIIKFFALFVFYFVILGIIIVLIRVPLYSPKGVTLKVKKTSKNTYSRQDIFAPTLALASSENSSPSNKYMNFMMVTETPTPTPTFTPTPTPTITPTPKPTIVSGSILEELFEKYANHYNLDKELLKRIAYCESKFNVGAVNGPYAGLYQFTVASWIATRVRMGLEQNPDLRFNAEESIKTASFKIAGGGINAWPNCKKF